MQLLELIQLTFISVDKRQQELYNVVDDCTRRVDTSKDRTDSDKVGEEGSEIKRRRYILVVFFEVMRNCLMSDQKTGSYQKQINGFSF